MSTITPVTVGQVGHIRKVSIEKGVSRWKFKDHALENGMMDGIFDELKKEHPRNLVIPFVRLPGINIATIEVETSLNTEDWAEEANTAAPDTHHGESSILKAGDFYPPTGEGIVKEDLVLLNFTEGGSWDNAFHWKDRLDLEEADPRLLFALSRKHPRLLQDLALQRLAVVATKAHIRDGKPLACAVWFDPSGKRTAGTNYLSFWAAPYVWFLFRKVALF